MSDNYFASQTFESILVPQQFTNPLELPVVSGRNLISPHTIAFVDPNISDAAAVMANLRSDVKILLDPNKDGITQIAEALRQYQGLSGIEIVSHGDVANLQLGTATLDANSLPQYTNAIEQWKSALAPQADILFYGCNVAAGASGRAFIDTLGNLTGADVAASTDLTGNAAKGGNWTLEYATGTIETATPFTAAFTSSYQDVFPSIFTTQTPANPNASDGVGSAGDYELGMKFVSSKAGTIDSIRYYKAASETGSHIGRIWSDSGQLLSSVNFSNETASGWQEQALAAPLSVNALTPYVVSVNANSYFAITPNGLGTTVTNGDLSTVADGANGVFNPTPTLFPNQSFQNTNYFRDVVFTPSSAPVVPQPIRINAGGGQYTDGLGQVWQADNFFSGGNTYSTGAPISGTTSDPLFQTERYGNFSYNIPVANGVYNVNLDFAELYWNSANSRVFNVSAEGTIASSNIDIFAAVGKEAAFVKAINNVTVTDGVLNLVFTGVTDSAKVDAIEILPGTINPSNNPSTVALAGTATQNQTLTANVADPDGVPTTINYQWQQSSNNGTTWTNITGATAKTYSLTQAQVGQLVRANATYTDTLGSSENINSSPTAAIANVNDLGTVTINGAPATGNSLSANVTDPDGVPSTINYQWQQSNDGTTWSNITGATAQSLTLDNSYLNKRVRINAAYTDILLGVENIFSTGTTPIATISQPIIRINAGGGQYTDGLGQVWQADNFFSGGNTYSTGAPISGTTSDPLFQSERWGNFSYNIPVANGVYNINLDFAELYWNSANSRVFNVSAEGTIASSNVDIFAAVGKEAAFVKAINNVTVTDGVLNLVFTGVTDNAKVDAIEILPGTLNPSNNPGTVALSGTTTQNQILTATTTDPDGLNTATVNYQWQQSTNGTTWTNITGATAQTFSLTQTQVGQLVRAGAIYTDTLGSSENVTSNPTAAIANVNDLGTVTINGTPSTGSVLSANVTDPDGVPSTINYQWQQSNDGTTWSNITGATAQSLTLDNSYLNKRVRINAAYTDILLGVENIFSTGTTPIATISQPIIRINAGGGQYTDGLGQVWQADTFFSGGNTYSTGAPISGTTSDPLFQTERYGNFSYNIPVANGVYNVNLDFAELYWNSANSRVFNVSAEGTIASSNIDIFAAVGKEAAFVKAINNVTVTDGVLNLVFTGVTDSAKVDAIEILPGTINPSNNPGSVALSGTAAQNQTLTATTTDPDGFTAATVSYQWQQSTNGTTWTNIAGATAQTLNLTQAQVGQLVRARAIYTDTLGSSENVTSNPTVAIANVNDPGTVAINGTPSTGSTLSANVTDLDGLPSTINYQWQQSNDGANWSNIAGAATASLTLDNSYLNKRVRINAVYTDVLNGSENIFSTATAPIATISQPIIRINAGGGQYTDGLGQVWQADNFFSGGNTYSTGAPISGTTSDPLFQTERWGNFAYNIPIANGVYNINLDFAELYWNSPNSRVFNVSAEGTIASSNVDIFAAVGKEAAFVKAINNVTVTDGVLNLVFTGVTDNAKVDAIEILPGIANPNNIPGSVALSGTATQNQILTANITDSDGVPTTINYQWQQSSNGTTWTNISAATAKTLNLTQAQVGQLVRANATYTDALGTNENVTSNATVAVANVNDLGVNILKGSATIGRELDATVLDADGLTGVTINYQWQQLASNIWTNISGATTKSLTLTNALLGQQIRSLASYIDALGASENVSSIGTTITAQNQIVLENQKAGTTAWQITNQSNNSEIAGYASATSINKGELLPIKVSMQTPGQYQIDIYRLGYYGGAGGRSIASSGVLNGVTQAAPTIDPTTRLVECNWATSYNLLVGNDWTSGLYTAKLTDITTGRQSQVEFTVRDDNRPAEVGFQSSVTDYEAYNNYGGYSLYNFNSNNNQAAYAVSFDRPLNNYTNGEFNTRLRWEYNMVRWMESQGYDISYFDDIDTDTNPLKLYSQNAFLSVGHDEYWSMEQRNNVEQARDNGINLAFFSANTAYWRVRYQPSTTTGSANRVMVVYKNNWALDPVAQLDNSQATTLFRSPQVNRPENALLGVMYVGDRDEVYGGADFAVTNSTDPYYANTGLQNGDVLTGLVGFEWDAVVNNGFTPAGLTVLSQSPVSPTTIAPGLPVGTNTNISNAVRYTAASGAKVFSTGSIQWMWGLDSDKVTNPRVDPRAQQIAVNVFKDMKAIPSTPRPGLVV
jgi:predicted nucleic acid-binding Zn finger protein